MRTLEAEQTRAVENVGRRIAELREGKGLTQETFSIRLGTSFQYVSRVEKGQNLTIFTLVKIAGALRVSLSDLFALPSKAERPKRGRPKKKPV